MTIRLLTDWPYKRASNAGYVTIPAGSIVSVFDAATETGMIAAKVAAASAAAVTWTPPSDAPIYTDLLPAEVVAVRSLVSGAGDFTARPTALLYPGDGKTLAAPTVGANATLVASGTEIIDGEEWRWYTVSATNTSGNYIEVVVPTFAPMTADSVAVRWASSAVASTIAAVPYLGTTSFSTNVIATGSMGSGASTTGYKNHTGMITSPAAYTDFSKTGFTRDTSEQLWTNAKIRFSVTNGSTVTIKLHSFYAGFRQRKGRICIISDDGYHSWIQTGAEILARYGLKSTCAVIADLVGASSLYATQDQLRAYVGAGNMCVPHGPRGGAGNIFSANATDALALEDMQFHRDWLVARGLTNERGAKCYVWPQGEFARTAGDPSMLDRAWNAGFRLARNADVQTSRFCNASYLGHVKSNLLGVTLGHRYAGAANTADDATEDTNIANIITRAQFVAAAGLDSYLVLHEVVGRGAASTTIQIETDRLHTLCAALQTLVAAGTLECVTMDQFVPL